MLQIIRLIQLIIIFSINPNFQKIKSLPQNFLIPLSSQFDTLHLDYLIQQNSYFKISKAYEVAKIYGLENNSF